MITADTFVLVLAAFIVAFLGGGATFVTIVLQRLTRVETQMEDVLKRLGRRVNDA